MTSKDGSLRNCLNAIHIDLKGVLFKPSYISQFMRDLSSQGVNAVLVEYEDVFPFTKLDIAWDRETAWSPTVLRRFLREAGRNRIEVIPLQQCLGHLEYVFRWRKYRRLAEDRTYPGTLCLAAKSGRKLILEMLRQVLEAHPDSRYVHLGMDEARKLATCPKCSAMGDTLDVFLAWLRQLVEFVEGFGMTPIIWSDMLEDHFRDGVFDDIRDRVILAPWNYEATGSRTKLARMGGWRIARAWLNEPENPDAPPIGPNACFLEDITPRTRNLIGRHLHGREVDSLFQVDLWTQLGFRVLGAGFVRVSADGDLFPRYNRISENARCWARAIERTGQLGLVGTSWARGTTFCRPNFSIDLCWPSIAEQSRLLGRRPKRFWPGVPPATVKRLVAKFGRCHSDWRIEGQVADEMEALAPRLKEHGYEWRSLALMARASQLRRRAEFALLEVDDFHAGIRLVESEWQRRINEQKRILADIAKLRTRVRRHFARRYHGEHFEEWMCGLFDLHEEKLKQATRTCRDKLVKARKAYAGRASCLSEARRVTFGWLREARQQR